MRSGAQTGAHWYLVVLHLVQRRVVVFESLAVSPREWAVRVPLLRKLLLENLLLLTTRQHGHGAVLPAVDSYTFVLVVGPLQPLQGPAANGCALHTLAKARHVVVRPPLLR